MYKAHTIHQHFKVDFSYNVIFTRTIFDANNTTLIDMVTAERNRQPKITVVLEQDIARCHPDIQNHISDYFHMYGINVPIDKNILTIQGGEGIKNDPSVTEKILQLINDNNVDRHSYLIVIGGGALLDAAGFAAATAHRGVRLIRVPTTVLSQNDSGVGVKNSVNYFGKKNFLGTFAPPFAVINDADFLETLDDRNWRSGIAEAVKVALIKDEVFFNWIETHIDQLNSRNMEVMERLIFRCAQLHLEHIAGAGDPFEKGSSRPLDFGHWLAHKLEYLSSYQLLHGEAVAIGIAVDTVYSWLSGLLHEEDMQRILSCLKELGFELSHPLLQDEASLEINNDLYGGLEEFREHLGGELTIMLLAETGQGIEVHELSKPLLSQAVEYLTKFSVLIHKSA